MKKALAAIAALLLTVLGAAVPAQATTYKTTVLIAAPKFAAAGIPVTVDVSVCAYATRSATVCDYIGARAVTLYSNKKKVATVSTNYGIAEFKWTPAAAGKYSLTATAAAIAGYKVANAAATSVTVAKKTTKTPLAVKFCDDVSCENVPMKMSFDNTFAGVSGLLGSTAAAKNRTAHLQYASTKNDWKVDSTAKSKVSSEFGQYSVDFSLNYSSDIYCTNGDETYDWAFRVIVDGTAKYAPVAGPMTIINFDCGGSGGSTSTGIGVTDDYIDLTIDSSFESLPNITASVTDPDNVGYEVDTYWCRPTDDCTDPANWSFIDSAFSTGDDTFSMGADWGQGIGSYYLQVEVTPNDGSDVADGPIHLITIN